MDRLSPGSPSGLVDSSGAPLRAELQDVLWRLAPRLMRAFPQLRDEAVIANVLEAVGRRIARREQEAGPLHQLHGYAWVALRRAGLELVQRLPMLVDQATLGAEASAAVLASLPGSLGSPEQIERELMYEEALQSLTDLERRICGFKRLGFTSEEIGARETLSVAQVDTYYYRAKGKIRKILTEPVARPDARAPRSGTVATSPEPPSTAGDKQHDAKPGRPRWTAPSESGGG